MNTSSLLDAYLEGGPQGGGGVPVHDRAHRSSVEEAYHAAAEDAAHHDGYEEQAAYHPPRAESAPAGRPNGHLGTPFAEIQNQPQYAGFQAGPQQAYQGKHSAYTPGRRQQQPMGIFRAMREADARRSVEPRRPPMEPYTVPLDASNAEVRNLAADTAMRARLHQIRTDLEARSYRQQLLEQLQQHHAIFNGSSSESPRQGLELPLPRPGFVAPRPYTSPSAHSAAAAAAGRVPPATAHGYAGRTSLEDYLQQYGGQGHMHAPADAAPTWLGSAPQAHHVSSYPAVQQQQQQQERPWSLPTTLQQYLDAANATTSSSSSSRAPQPFPHLQRLLDNAPLLPHQQQAQAQRSRPQGLASPFANPSLQQQSDGGGQEPHLDGRFTSNSSTVAVMALKASLEELKQLRGRLQATAAAANGGSSSSAGHSRAGRAAAAGARPWQSAAGAAAGRRPHTSAGVMRPGYAHAAGGAAASSWQMPGTQPGTWAAAAAPSSLWQQQPTAAAAAGGPAVGAPTWDVWSDTPWEKRMKEALQQQRHPAKGPSTGRPHTAAPALFTQHPGSGAAAGSRGHQRAQSAPRGASYGPAAAAGGRARLFGSPVKLFGQQGAGLGRQQQAVRGAPAGGWLQGSPIRRMAARSPGGAAAAAGAGAAAEQQRPGPSEAALAAAAAELGASFAQRSRYGAGGNSRYAGSAPSKAAPAWGSRPAQRRPSSGGGSSSSSDDGSSSCSEAGGRRQQPGLGRGLAAVDMVLQQARSSR